ncbi:pentatricopeptide repeat-containing protein 1, mitochondrial-like [Actinia tenebrosa]|uniref:Pentatricopeptide repeat-containing protein 1, mitochondrial-like n=1 Tax=Actinia tenebrosa TaxID=6105 RepID=A0A6P8I983_ACTTE|nr:pentatricopeptide repeat-containing protein 1, mitochondrial-like [Actinia tenebrosa]
MAYALLRMCRQVYCKKYIEILRFRGSTLLNTLSIDSRNSVRYYSSVSSLANLEVGAHQMKTGKFANIATRYQHFFARQILFTNFGSFLGSRKNWKAGYSGLSTFKSGNIVNSNDDDDDEEEDNDDTKARKFKNKSTRRKVSNAKYSTKVQKAGDSLMRPSRYAFKDLSEEDEDQRWVRRPIDDNMSKRKVDWYTKQMAHLISEREVDKAQELFNSMRLENIRPTTEIFNILIAGYGKTGKIRKAFHNYNNIKKMGLQPTAHTFTSLFTICAQISTPNLSLSQLLKLWEEFQEGVKNDEITPDIITYNAAMKAAASSKSLAVTLDIYEDICSNNLPPDCRTYSSLLGACAGEGDTDKLSWVLKEMKEHNVKPDLFVFNALLRAVRDSRSRNAKENRETFAMEKLTSLQHETQNKEKTDRNAKIDSSSAPSMEEYLDIEDSDSAVNALEVSSDKDNSTAPTIFTGTEEILQLMAVNDILPDIRTFHLLLQIAKLEVDEEEYILNLMKEWNIKPDLPVLNALVKRRALFGDVTKAQAYMKIFEEEFDVNPNKTTYQSLARGCRKKSDGMWLLKEMEEKGFPPDILVHSKMIKNATYRQDFQFLTELLKEMKKSHVKPTAEILLLLDEIANKPDNDVLKKRVKAVTRQEKKSQFIRKQRLGFYGFYKTWRHQIEQIEQNKAPKHHNAENDSKVEKKEKEEISYDHL